jgi:hypothetical protein
MPCLKKYICLQKTKTMKLSFLITGLFLFKLATAQNVGIGTTAPTQKLDVRGSTADDSVRISVGNADGSHQLGLYGGRLNDPNPFIIWKAGDPLRFVTDYNGFSELMRIMPNGNVGIGTTSPDLAKLQVRGMVGNTVAMFSDMATSTGIALVADYPGVFFNSYWNNGLRSMSASGYSSFIETDQTSGALTFNVAAIANTTANGLITVPERMRITSSGQVGIGTSSPGFPLNFANTVGDKISLYGNTGNHFGLGIQSSLLQIHTDIAGSDIAFGYGSSGSFTERMRILNNTSYDGMSLNGRLILKNGSTDLIGGGAGVWLYKANNTALLGFMGTQNNQNVGFFGGPDGWGFTYNALNSRVGIGNNNPNAPLAFGATTGKKLVLYPGTTGDFGFGIASGRLQIFSENNNSDVAIGNDIGGTFTERLSIRATGSVAFNGNAGTAGQILQSNGNVAAPKWLSMPYFKFLNQQGDQYSHTELLGVGPVSVPIPGIDNQSIFLPEASQVMVNLKAFLIPVALSGLSSGRIYIEIWESATNTLKLALSANGYANGYDGTTISNMEIVDLNAGFYLITAHHTRGHTWFSGDSQLYSSKLTLQIFPK